MAFRSLNPATEEVLASFEEFSARQIDEALQEAYDAQRRWRKTSFGERAAVVRALGRVLHHNRNQYARLITAEMGKPLIESEAEIDKCVWNCDYYAANAASMLADEVIATNGTESYVRYQPLGVVLAIMPWNYPFWQAVRFLAPAFMAGNGSILKHASNVPQCALAIEAACREAGVPAGLFHSVLVPGTSVASLIVDSRIAAVTLTGSSAAGSQVAAVAGTAIKKQVLELGGSDAFIVLDDADLKAAASAAARSRNQNSGQSCIAAKRFIVEAAVADEFAAKLADAVRELRMGDPLARDTNVGPMARSDLRESLGDQVERSVQQGARVLVGGRPVPGRGFFYTPTVLDGVTGTMPAYCEETFGPVAAVLRADSDTHAIELANASEYGLSSALWTADVERAKELAQSIEAGGVFINGMTASDPRLPFGGIKRSGYGRELAANGIREFTNIQTVWIGPATGPQIPSGAESE